MTHLRLPRRAIRRMMKLPFQPPLLPMEALAVDEVPAGPEWQYEPKWDGFRCLVFREGGEVQLQSKAGQPLARYFPEIVEAVLALEAETFVLDGELMIPEGDAFSFDQLLQRVHPAASRVRKLAAETPALLVAFDLLADAEGKSLLETPLVERRVLLEQFAGEHFVDPARFRLSPVTADIEMTSRWLAEVGSALDGIIAKRADLGYRSGERTGMVKIKNYRSVDCVVGGFRYGQGKSEVGSLLLGLYDEAGLLHHVGFTSTIKAADRAAVTKQLEKLVEAPGFTGRAPGGPSRWSAGRSTEWKPLRAELVVEVSYDHLSGGRFRHGTKLLRWRPDKAPEQCTMEQVRQRDGNPLRLLAP